MTIDEIIDDVMGREGRYSNNPSDPGGATMWGVTERVARANGYNGPMNALPRETAKDIYFNQYVRKPGFSSVMQFSEALALELVDTGINMGPAVASIMLQRSLNALNDQGRYYADIAVDGDVGPATLTALSGFIGKRGSAGVVVLLKALNCLQGDRYIEIAEKRQASEDFVYGWLANRVSL